MANSKAETFLGFCVKARKLAIGSDAIERLQKGVYLLVTCSTLSENSFKKALKFQERFSCPLMICYCNLSEVLHIAGCKMAAIKDKNLASAVLSSADKNFQVYLGGKN